MMELSELVKFIVPAIIVIVVLAILLSGYVKASPDTAYIISGMRK